MPAGDAGQPLARAPQAGRIEAANDQLAFRDQHPLDFAQHLVRLGGEFEHMRQHHQVQAVRIEGQFVKSGDQLERAALRLAGRQARIDLPFVGHAAGGQRVELGQAQLHRVKAEDIDRQAVQTLLFPLTHVQAGRRLQPAVKRYNGFFGCRTVHSVFSLTHDQFP